MNSCLGSTSLCSELLQRMIGYVCLLGLIGAITSCEPKSEKNWKNADIRWYSTGTVTANGERFDPNSLTCASRTLKFGTFVDIAYGSVILSVRVNDRGPNEVELTKGAFSKLADPSIGVLRNAKIKIQ